MLILLHGGKCCGIKHIHGLGMYPDAWVEEKEETEAPPPEASQFVNSPLNFYTGARPAEEAIKRLDVYLDYLREKRPKGLVEIVLAAHQFVGWREPLQERGFKLVSTFLNGNSGHKCEVYHLEMKP